MIKRKVLAGMALLGASYVILKFIKSTNVVEVVVHNINCDNCSANNSCEKNNDDNIDLSNDDYIAYYNKINGNQYVPKFSFK